MLRKAVEEVGDAGLDSLRRLSTRRSFLAKSLAVAGAAVGLTLAGDEAEAATSYYCVATGGCTVRDGPWGAYVTTYGKGYYASYSSGAYDWNTPYTGCLGVQNGDMEYYWRKRAGYTRYVHANLLSTSSFASC